jgi:tetratricopeptide (TPR) repeat protein
MKLAPIFFAAAAWAAGGGSETALQMANRGARMYASADYGEAEALYRQALEAWPTGGGAPRGRAIVSGNLGTLLCTVGRYDEAERILWGAVKELQGMGSAAYPDAGRLLDTLAVLYRLRGGPGASRILRAASRAHGGRGGEGRRPPGIGFHLFATGPL